MKYIVGIDEVGRGPIAGPVTVCAFIVPTSTDLLSFFKGRKLRDSKKLSDKQRREIRTQFNKAKLKGELDFVIVSKSAEYIDTYGISKAVQACIQDALNKLRLLQYPLDKSTTIIHLDGALKIDEDYTQKLKVKYGVQLSWDTTIKGDEKIPVIACASIMAKITRDNFMVYSSKKVYNKEGKYYSWDRNVGYGTREHYEHLQRFGIHGFHRKTFLKHLAYQLNKKG